MRNNLIINGDANKKLLLVLNITTLWLMWKNKTI